MRPGQIALVNILLASLCAGGVALGGCDSIGGGAVELSWRFRPEPGAIPDNPCDPFVCCDSQQPFTNPIARVQLHWSVDGDGSSASWDCDAGNGVTRFDVPAGEALLSVAPVCQGSDGGTFDADPTTYTAPAPEARTVTVGDTVTLGAVEVLLRISACDSQTCICGNPPSSAQENVEP